MRGSSFVSVAVVAGTLAVAPASADAAILAQWVQLGPDGSANARAITDEATCPMVTFDGVITAMDTRSAPEQAFGNVKEAKFPVRGCEALLPPGTRAAVLAGKPL